MAGGGEAIPEGWKELVRSLGNEQLVDAIYVAMDDFKARDRDTIPPELWRQIDDRRAAYKNPFVSDGSGSGSSAGEEEVERIKSKLEVEGDGGSSKPSSDSSEEAVVELLRALQSVPMTFETLEATKIGKTISGLRKHSSEQVRDLAAVLYKDWKALVNEHFNRTRSKPPAPTKTAFALAVDRAMEKTAAATKPAPALPALPARPRPTGRNKRKEAPALPEMDEAKLEAARKKLRERYREEETAKERKIQMINAPGKAKQRPAVIERRRVVRETVVGVVSRAPVRSSRRT